MYGIPLLCLVYYTKLAGLVHYFSVFHIRKKPICTLYIARKAGVINIGSWF